MKHYSILPEDWDYTNFSNVSREFYDKKIYTPTQIPEVIKHCGSLFPYITNEKKAIAYVKQIKAKFPYVSFTLYEGATWGEMQVVAEF